jgi:hypothetical protein
MATLVKVKTQFDYYVPGVKMTSYAPDGGEYGDGFHEMPQHHLEAARKAGALDEDAQPPVRKDETAAEAAGADGAVVKVAGSAAGKGK